MLSVALPMHELHPWRSRAYTDSNAPSVFDFYIFGMQEILFVAYARFARPSNPPSSRHDPRYYLGTSPRSKQTDSLVPFIQYFS